MSGLEAAEPQGLYAPGRARVGCVGPLCCVNTYARPSRDYPAGAFSGQPRPLPGPHSLLTRQPLELRRLRLTYPRGIA